jgi:hypothetical protein
LARPLNVRRALLAAVEGFLEATPASVARAHRNVGRAAQCLKTLDDTTLDEVWSGIISELGDSVFYEDPDILRARRTLLEDGSSEIHRAYLSHDFRPQFTSVERDWYTHLWDLLEFLGSLPGADAEATIAEYERRRLDITRLAAQSPPPDRLGDETIYHLVLREANEIATNVYPGTALLSRGRLVPDGTYSTIHRWTRDPLDREPDPRDSFAWARHALGALAADGWLLITWQVTPQNYNLSLH